METSECSTGVRGVSSDFPVLCGGCIKADSDGSGENSGCHVGLDPTEVRRTNGAPGITHRHCLTATPPCVDACVPDVLHDGGGVLARHHGVCVCVRDAAWSVKLLC